MSFLKIRQTTLTGEWKAYVSTSAISYVQEIIPDQDIIWQVGVEPSRSLIYLHHRLDPIITLDRPEEIMRQVKANLSENQTAKPKLPKKSR
jgi:hypothetical protein